MRGGKIIYSLISKEEDFKINMEILQAANKEKPMLNKYDRFSWLLVPEQQHSGALEVNYSNSA